MGWLLVVKVGVNLVLLESVLDVMDKEDEPVTAEPMEEVVALYEVLTMTLVIVEVAVELLDEEDDPVTGSAVMAEPTDEVVQVKGGLTVTDTVGIAVELPDDVSVLRPEEELRVLVKVPTALTVLVENTVVSSIELYGSIG